MAKTRAQRKAERRRRQQERERRGGGALERDQAEREEEERAQEDTQRGVSGEVAEAEAVLRTGAHTEDYGETVEAPAESGGDGSPVPGVLPAPVRPEPPTPEAPAPSRADVGRAAEAPAEPRESRRERRQREKEERRKARAKELQKGQAEKAQKRRGPVLGFLLSCWAELKRVQWPDRDTLVQASAVTFIFVAIMAAYLGALDAAFNWFVQRLL
ncbi:MAG: preprotein translocase subunit SecE [Solirubrobacterales bacterium]|nr:preprotein translocase subunit SecE [Solirubrobacterales bacterium]